MVQASSSDATTKLTLIPTSPTAGLPVDSIPGGSTEPVPEALMEPFPEFAVVMRGFDRTQVDAYIGEQRARVQRADIQAAAARHQLAEAADRIAALEHRIRQLEEQQLQDPAPSIEALGQRVARILDEAWTAAQELRAEAHQAMQEATAQAAQMVAAAESDARQHAAAIVEEAEQQRRSVLQGLHDEQQRLEATIEELHSRREQAVGQLGALHLVLTQALAADDGPAAQSTDTDTGADPTT